jgi:folate-binding protein YgfZ
MSRSAAFCELDDLALICFSGEDAVSFLHAQLTSDVAALGALKTQYGGYCSPKGRLLTTFLLWRLPGDTADAIVLQLPAAVRESVQNRLARYVLRSRVKVTDATSRYRLYGLDGNDARKAIEALGLRAPASDHDVAAERELRITRLQGDRYLLLAPAERADALRASLENVATREDSGHWAALDVAAGIPVITEATQEAYVPQMVNLDLIGGVSYAKGCYPGQEIVARTHYLGKLKQRMYRIGVRNVEALAAGQSLYSPEFGPDQASGAILYTAPRTGDVHEALAVVQRSSVEGQSVRLGALDGPAVEFLPLPYTAPD